MDKNLLETLKKRAEDREAARIEIKEFDVGGIPMKFKKLSRRDCLSYYARLTAATGNAADEGENGKVMINKDEMAICLEESTTIRSQLIYESCPTLQEPELHKEVGVTDPFDIVWKLLDISEINELGIDLSEWMGISQSPRSDKKQSDVKPDGVLRSEGDNSERDTADEL
ncbi:MAG: hypothetical protein HFE90_08330 [Firmicutes bacterium]|nr:hypothetical protein [Bacillota bacterium]